MPDRRRFAVVVPPLLALLLGVAAAILLPSGAAPAAAQSTEPAVTCFEISVGWRICVAPSPEPIAAASSLPSTTLSYGAPSTTGSVTDDGDYAFLTDHADLTSAITTYEGLRDGLRKGSPIGLVINQSDSAGTSHEAFYDLVEEGDLVEWREAADCWVRYHVDQVHADPAGDPPRRLLTIQVYSYAFTGCTSGPITTTGTRTFTWTPETIRTGNITVPFYHGPFLVAPEGWSGTLPEETRVAEIVTPWPPDPLPAPDLGPGWSGSVNASGPDYAYPLFVEYRHESGGGLGGMIRRLPVWPSDVSFHTNTPADQQRTHEWILIDGRPAEVTRWHHDTEGAPIERVRVSFYDAATGVLYGFSGGHQPPANDPEVLIELARQFMPDAHPSACRPRAPADGRTNDDADPALEDCGLPELTLAYNGPPSRTGSVTDAGDYAFLADPNDLTSAITTYEGLRDGLREGNPIGLVLHQTESGGVSQAAFYDLVRVGDLVQWWPASRCWVRYQVTEVHPDPPGAPPRKLLTIQVYSYAFLGTDRCSGTIIVTDDRPRQLFDWSPWVIRTGPLSRPFYHGPFLVVPEGWTGTLPDQVSVTPPDIPWPPDPLPSPDLGTGWTGGVTAGNAHYSWRAGDALFVSYRHESGGRLEGTIYRLPVWPRGIYSHADIPFPDEYREWILIDGRPAEVTYELDGEPRDDARVSFYDAATGVFYTFWSGYQPPANDPAVLIEIALQFLPDAHHNSCQPRAPTGGGSNDTADLGLPDCGLPSTTLTYGAPTTTGSVTDDGDYAFLTDSDDLTTMVTTYEGLRDGSTTGLVIHQNDSGGTSQAAFYDLVEPGDLFEWREASDCFVRYTVTDVKDDPAGDPPRKLLAVAWMTYAFTGCSGAISSTATASLQWGPLPDLGGTSLAAPILHGPFQIVPEAWTGERVPWTRHDPPAHNRDNERYTTDPAEARTYPYWREPALPDHWVFLSAATDSDALPYGYRAVWAPNPWDGFGMVEILAGFMWGRRGSREAHVTDPSVIPSVYETRVIAGRPAAISYALPIDRDFDVVYLTIYDPATEAGYQIGTSHIDFRGENLDALIDLARSLFEPPNAP